MKEIYFTGEDMLTSVVSNCADMAGGPNVALALAAYFEDMAERWKGDGDCQREATRRAALCRKLSEDMKGTVST